jgi:sugar lactone lactonase YvrE
MQTLGTADTLLPNVATLAEGPRWDTRTQRLLWVDIEGCALHEYDPGADDDRAIALPSMVGSVALTEDPGRVLVGLADRLARVDLETGDVEPLAGFPHSRDGMRANDGNVDPAGRFWIGTMCLDEAPDSAALYRYDPDGSLTTVLEPVSLSNGLGWAAGEQRMYYIDSPTKRVDVLDYDPETGEVADRRPFARIEDGVGVPDGLALDVEDGVWVALYGGAQVRRYGPSGSLDAVIEVPADNVTACAFGGEDGRRMYITTARSPQPLGGSLFTAEPGIAGPPAQEFGA